MDDEVRAGIFDRLGRLLVTRGLALDLNAVFQRVRLAIPCKFYGTVAEKLVADNVTQSVVLILYVKNHLVHLTLNWRDLLWFFLVLEHLF